jgi:hypothetical protein
MGISFKTDGAFIQLQKLSILTNYGINASMGQTRPKALERSVPLNLVFLYGETFLGNITCIFFLAGPNAVQIRWILVPQLGGYTSLS